MQIKLGNRVFATKKALQQEFSRMLREFPVGTVLNDGEFTLVCDLLKQHPHYEEKRGVGISSIEIRLNLPPYHHQKGFWIIRDDGSISDFSYLVCLRPALTQRKVSWKQAAREAVIDQIVDFKNRYFNSDSPTCQVSGYPVDREDVDIHHAAPEFDEILQSFWNAYNIDPTNEAHLTHRQNGMGQEIVEPLLSRWQEYHRQNAVLKVVLKPAHRDTAYLRDNLPAPRP